MTTRQTSACGVPGGDSVPQPPPSADSRIGRLSPHLRGHFLFFDRKTSPAFDSSTTIRLLLIYVFLEAILGPRLSILQWFHIPPPPSWISVPALFVVAMLLVRFVARLEPARIGFYGCRAWSSTEKSYFVQVIVLANVVFAVLCVHPLQVIAADRSLWSGTCLVVFTQLVWGIYQELVYRGILQTALVSRWGPAAGILVANLAFTFGPLHFYHFSSLSGPTGGSTWSMFAGIFAIGLLFSVLFWRSGNLWMIGVMHGIGNAYIDGLARILARHAMGLRVW